MAERIVHVYLDGIPDDERVWVELWGGGQVVDVALTQPDGCARFLLEDLPDDVTELLARTPYGVARIRGEAVRDEPASVRIDAGMNLLTAVPSLAVEGQLSEPPDSHTYRGRVRPEDVDKRPWLVAGFPRTAAFPVNQFAQRYTARFLRATDELDNGKCWARGTMTEFQITWEPVGWALDEWIATTSLAPFEESALSEMQVHSAADVDQTADSTAAEHQRRVEGVTTSTEEVMNIATNSAATSRGVNVRLGGGTSGTTEISVDPVASLTKAVTGAIQLGYSAGSAGAETNSMESSLQAFRSGLKQASSQLRSSNAQAMLSFLSGMSDRRSLRALRNMSDGAALNLCIFSVTRQWLVTTVARPKQWIVYVPIHQLEKEFTPAELFEHRATLAGVLLEPRLLEALNDAADSYVPSVPAAPAVMLAADRRIEVRRIRGAITVSDPASGRRSRILLQVTFAEDIGDDTVFSREFHDLHPGVPQMFDMEINRPLHHLGGVSLKFDNPGVVVDRRAVVSEIRLTAVLANGEERELGGPWRDVVLPAGEEVQLRTPVLIDPSPPRRPQLHDDASLARLLAHFNANRPYYRLALDLQMDAVSRYLSMRARAEEMDALALLPTDMNPIGVAGAHIAFLRDKEKSTATGDEEPGERILDLLSTPAGGVFLEAVPGATSVKTPTSPPPWPTVAGGKDGGFAWPAPFQPAAPTPLPAAAPPPGGAPANGSSPAAKASPQAEASNVVTKADLDAIVEKLTASIAERIAEATKEITKPEGEKSGGEKSAKGEGEKDSSGG